MGEYLIYILILIAIYYIYQMLRNKIIFLIRKRWIENNDDNWHKLTYQYMLDPKRHNWYGLKFPKEKHYIGTEPKE